jgi:hypothetical protein
MQQFINFKFQQENYFCFSILPLLVQHLFQSLTIHHSSTTSYHQKCNSHAEVCNKTIEKYLAAFGDVCLQYYFSLINSSYTI